MGCMQTFDRSVKLTIIYNLFPVGQLMFESFRLVLRSTLTRFDNGVEEEQSKKLSKQHK